MPTVCYRDIPIEPADHSAQTTFSRNWHLKSYTSSATTYLGGGGMPGRTLKDKPVIYSKTCLKRPLKEDPQKRVFKTNTSLIHAKSIAECSPFLQYFQLSLSCHLPLRPLYSLFLNGRLRHFFCAINIYSQTSNTFLFLFSNKCCF